MVSNQKVRSWSSFLVGLDTEDLIEFELKRGIAPEGDSIYIAIQPSMSQSPLPLAICSHDES